MDYTNHIVDICNLIIIALMAKDYDELYKHNAFVRVAQNDLVRVLDEYGGTLTSIPPSAYETNAFQSYVYNDGSGYHIDLDLWIDGMRSDLTLQIDVKTIPGTNNITCFYINDLLVM